METDTKLQRIELVEDQPAHDEAAAKALSKLNIQFLLPAELDMVGGAALQFAYDSPTKYI